MNQYLGEVESLQGQRYSAYFGQHTQRNSRTHFLNLNHFSTVMIPLCVPAPSRLSSSSAVI